MGVKKKKRLKMLLLAAVILSSLKKLDFFFKHCFVTSHENGKMESFYGLHYRFDISLKKGVFKNLDSWSRLSGPTTIEQ